MKFKRTLIQVLIFIIMVTNIGCDQVTKSIVRQKIDYNERIIVIDDFITLTKVENTGAFLGLGNQLPKAIFIVVMIILPLIVIAYGLYYVLRKYSTLTKLLIIGICCIIGGGIGNIIDRVLYGSVTDFLHFDFVVFQTGIVNMADISVTVGVFLFIVTTISNRTEIKALTN